MTNFDIEKFLDTSDEWISSRTGIRQRRLVKDETTAFMASEALEKNITISYTVAYKKDSDQSFYYVSGSCVLESGATSVSDSGSLPIQDIVSNSAYVSSMSASPSSYTNSYSGTTNISCDI